MSSNYYIILTGDQHGESWSSYMSIFRRIDLNLLIEYVSNQEALPRVDTHD